MELFTKQIDDIYVRENFEKIQQSFNDLVFTLGDFQFFEFRIEGAQEEYKYYHNLGFTPNDIIVTKAIGSHFEIDYNGVTDEYITFQTTGDVYIRAFIGNMKGDEVKGANAFSNVEDDLGSTGGSGGSSGSFYERDVEVVGALLTTKKIVIGHVPIAQSLRIDYNGLPYRDYTINQNVITLNTDIYIGDDFYITYSA